MKQRRQLLSAALLLHLLVTPNWVLASDKIDACFVSRADARPVTVSLEVADTPAERRKGLMGRTGLQPNHGMLFIYSSVNDPDRGFWMKNTLIPLDIAYLGPSGAIVSIRAMQPCTDTSAQDCPVYPAGAKFQYAVELNQGFFEREGLKVGDTLNWLAPLPEACRRD